MTNTYKNKYCDWCGKSCIDNGIDIKQGNSTQGYAILCSFCIKFPRIDVMQHWQHLITTFALTSKGVRITSIDYDEETEDYTINFEWYDNEQARMGWVA